MGNLLQKNSQKHQEDEEEDDDSTLACEICIEPISSNKKFKNNHNCTHSFCMDCMASYIQVKVEDQYVPDVACPALDCGHLLNPLHYLPILAAKLFTKWSDLLCEKVVLLGFERCYCPNQTCSVLIVNECGGNVRRSKCPNCKKLFCFQCKSPWHSGYRCDKREEMRDVNDMLFGELVETKKWSRCPSCGHCVELVEGCPNVSCRFVFFFFSFFFPISIEGFTIIDLH